MNVDWVGGTTLRMAYPRAHFYPRWFWFVISLALALVLLHGGVEMMVGSPAEDHTGPLFFGAISLLMAAAIGLVPAKDEFRLDDRSSSLIVVARPLLLRNRELLSFYPPVDLSQVKVGQRRFAFGDYADMSDLPHYVRLCFRSSEEVVITYIGFSYADAVQTARSIVGFPGVEAALELQLGRTESRLGRQDFLGQWDDNLFKVIFILAVALPILGMWLIWKAVKRGDVQGGAAPVT